MRIISRRVTKELLCVILIGFFNTVDAQNFIDWDGKYVLQLSDFKSPATQIGGTTVSRINSSAGISFSYQMSVAEFMFTKNFNSKVNCRFQPDGAALIAPDSLTAEDLLSYARYEFDLSELYARKFRKRMYEEKAAMSDANFANAIFEEIQNELVARAAVDANATEVGREKQKLAELHLQVKSEIETLADFCKSCKLHFASLTFHYTVQLKFHIEPLSV